MGVTILGVIVNRRFSEGLVSSLPPGYESLAHEDISTLGNLLLGGQGGMFPPAVIEGIRTALSESITFAFLVSAFIVLGAFTITISIRRVPLREREEAPESVLASEGAPADTPEDSGQRKAA